MNPDIKQRWLTALRSGEYKQGQKYLRRNGEYCCLGVLSEIIKDEVPEWRWQAYVDKDMWHWRAAADGSDAAQMIPVSVCDHIDFDREEAVYLSNMNDKGAPFSDIADYIEREL